MGKKNKSDGGTLVYSSGPDGARSFGRGGKVVDGAGAASSMDIPPALQKLSVVHDAKAGHGRGLTVISGLILTSPSLGKLAKQLKSACGTGGTVRGATIELQGEHRARVVKMLTDMGFQVA